MANNYDIAHAWAHNIDRRHGSGSFRHNYGKIYSYSTVIGQRLEINGNIVFLVNTYSYSNSTCKHQRYMESAIPKGDNIFTFADPECQNSYGMIDTWRMNSESWKSELVRYGLKMLAREYENCVEIDKLNRMEHSFSRKGFDEMCRWFSVTGCITLPKLLKMSANDIPINYPFNISNYDIPDFKHFKSFLKAMADGKPLEEIVDLVNGKGAWEHYLNRTASLRLAKKHREWSNRLGFLTPQTRWTNYYGNDKIMPVVKGSVTKKDIDKHTKAGDLISWLLSVKRHNCSEAVKAYELNKQRERIELAKARLERHIGMSGFVMKWSPFYKCDRQWFTSFNYDGTVISFGGRNGCHERSLSMKEYAEYRTMSPEQQQSFIHEKRLWMLNQLQTEQREWEEREARWAEERRIAEEERQERERLLNEKREYIDDLKAQGASGYRQLYHEGLPVSLPYGTSPVYYGGNVLLRFNEKRNLIETSKSIRLSVDEARKLWIFVSRCHTTGGANAKGLEIHCVGHTYTVHSYQDDILTAGCHQIAYPEMAYMARQLNLTV